jgi:hypothetical protein
LLRKFNGNNRKKAVVEVIINEIKRDILIKLFIQRYYQKENINVFSFVLIDSCAFCSILLFGKNKEAHKKY